jgi:thiopurine S-methyltransferase
MQNEWEGYWAAGRTGFHKNQIHPMLERYFGHMMTAAGERVLVPLCGKTLDLPWLEARTTEVVGCEWVAQAVVEFFREQGREATAEQRGAHCHHISGRLSIVQGDFLTLTPEHVQCFDACWDRAAMIALPPETRKRYVPHLVSLMKPNGRILLVTYDTDKPADAGPPYPVKTLEVQEAYAPYGSVELLESIHHTPETDERVKAKGLAWVREDVFCITLKG